MRDLFSEGARPELGVDVISVVGREPDLGLPVTLLYTRRRCTGRSKMHAKCGCNHTTQVSLTPEANTSRSRSSPQFLDELDAKTPLALAILYVI